MTPLRTSVLFIAGALAVWAQRPQVEWLYYGGDPGNSKYSTLTDINAGNIQRLQIAWQWKHWETPLQAYGTTPGFFENTPLMIDGVLYVTTPYNSIAAVDAETGKELWRFDGEGYKLGQVLSGSGWKLRGTAFWRDGGKLRMFLNSRDRLFSLDAQTGKPVASFGDNGVTSLTQGLPRISDIKHVTQSSPPVVYEAPDGGRAPDKLWLSTLSSALQLSQLNHLARLRARAAKALEELRSSFFIINGSLEQPRITALTGHVNSGARMLT